MKILRQEPFVINDTTLEKVDIPSDSELNLASFAIDGKPLLQYWFEFDRKLQNNDGTKIRNRSSQDVIDAHDVDGYVVVREFPQIRGNEYLRTRFRNYAPLAWNAKEFTIFAVVKANITTGNTFVIGQNVVDANIVNPPNINISNTGLVYVYKNGVSTPISNASVPSVLSQLTLLTVSQSATNGCIIRADKVVMATGTSADATLEGNCQEVRLMGGAPSMSANLNGDIAALILCPKDLTNSLELTDIEDYLFEKYC